MPNRLSQEEIRLLEALLKTLSPNTDVSKGAGFVEIECVKDADEEVYNYLADQLKKLGIQPTPQRVQGLFDRLVYKGSGR